MPISLRQRIFVGFLAFLVVAAVAAVATAPPALVKNPTVLQLDADLDGYLSATEHAINAHTPIIPNTEKRIRWFQAGSQSKTAFSIVYLHGFSATRQEIAPVLALVADGLEANLFETRLAGHGLGTNALVGVQAEDWLDDAAEALQIGAAIGERVIVMGTSTGATLALAIVDHPSFDRVSSLVLISPNFGPRDMSSEFLTWPGGPQLAYLVAGDTHSWTPHNELQARYWSYRYPMDALVEMMRLVKFVRAQLPLGLEQDLLMIYSPQDEVVDTGRIISSIEQINSPRKLIVEFNGSDDSSHHVLAGDIMAPDNNGPLVQQIIDFVNAGPR